MAESVLHATGKRKRSVARVYLRPGKGEIKVNKRGIDEYFPRPTSRMLLRQPLELTNTGDLYDIYVNVGGGGLTGQAGAIRDGITKALIQGNPELRATLKRAGMVTRDSRIKERKKYGQRGARASFQFSKR